MCVGHLVGGVVAGDQGGVDHVGETLGDPGVDRRSLEFAECRHERRIECRLFLGERVGRADEPGERPVRFGVAGGEHVELRHVHDRPQRRRTPVHDRDGLLDHRVHGVRHVLGQGERAQASPGRGQGLETRGVDQTLDVFPEQAGRGVSNDVPAVGLRGVVGAQAQEPRAGKRAQRVGIAVTEIDDSQAQRFPAGNAQGGGMGALSGMGGMGGMGGLGDMGGGFPGMPGMS